MTRQPSGSRTRNGKSSPEAPSAGEDAPQPSPSLAMGRHQRWISREPFDEEVASWGSPPVGWGFAKAVLVCGLAGGVLGSSIGAALGTTGHAGLAAMIGGIPPAGSGGWRLGGDGGPFARPHPGPIR